MSVKITQTNGNSKNGIRGSRIRIWNSKNELVDEFTVPAMYGAMNYINRHPGSQYTKRFNKAIEQSKI